MAKKTAPAKPVDLADFDKMAERMEEGILVPIHQPLPNGKTAPLGFSIRIAGPDSQRALDALDAIQSEVLDEESDDPATAREIAQRQLRYFAKVTMDFVPEARPNGTVPDVAIILDKAPLPYSEENALKLYQRFKFIYDQVKARANTRAAFIDG